MRICPISARQAGNFVACEICLKFLGRQSTIFVLFCVVQFRNFCKYCSVIKLFRHCCCVQVIKRLRIPIEKCRSLLRKKSKMLKKTENTFKKNFPKKSNMFVSKYFFEKWKFYGIYFFARLLIFKDSSSTYVFQEISQIRYHITVEAQFLVYNTVLIVSTNPLETLYSKPIKGITFDKNDHMIASQPWKLSL